MRYPEQIKYSLSYHWGVFREIWDVMTLGKWRWLVVFSLLFLSVIPSILFHLSPNVSRYIAPTLPVFFPSMSQELAMTVYFATIKSAPSLSVTLSYYWVTSRWFGLFTKVLCVGVVGLLLVAYLREE